MTHTAPPQPALAATVVPATERTDVIPLLMLAEPSYSALRWSLDNLSDTVYRFDMADELVAAATMRWEGEPCELVELAVAPGHQREGLGRRVIEWLADEARQRGVASIQVGTRSTSLANIAFYQSCGFRPLSVRRDYFWYYPEPIVEQGIVVRDMLVFELDLAVTSPGEQGAVRR